MAIIVSDSGSSEGSSLEPIAAGMYQAVCYGVVGLGTQTPLNPAHKAAFKLRLCFEIPELKETNDEGQEFTRTASKKYTLSLHEKSKLRPDLVSWRGRDFTDQELRGFDLENLLGVPCTLQVIQKEFDGKTIALVNAIMPPMAETDGTREHISYMPQQHSPEMYEKLSEFWKKDIEKSPEYQKAIAGNVTEQIEEAPQDTRF